MPLGISIKQIYREYAFKGGLIALLALLAAYLLGIQQSYWVLFGAITVTKLHAGISFYRGKQRVYGTTLGVVISLLLAMLLSHWTWGMALIIPLCIFGAVYYFSDYAVCMVFITILFVLAIEMSSHHPIHYGLARIFDTLLGVSFAIMVTSYFWPSYATKAVERNFQHYFSQVDTLFSVFTQAFIGKKLSLGEKNRIMRNLDEAYAKLKENIVFVEYEFDKKANFQEQTKNIFLKLSHLYSFLNTLGCLATENVKIIPDGELHQLLVVFINKTQNSSSIGASEEYQKIFDYLQHTSIKTEQEQQWTVEAFVQTVCSIVDEMKNARQASQSFC